MPPSTDKFYSARILERRDLSDDLWIIHVDPGGEYRYRPGQYATLGVVTPEKHYERAYSIVSAPHEKLLEFFIELVPHGELTPLLHQQQVGDSMTLRKSGKGRFTLDVSSGRSNHFLIGTVTGVSPYVSYARSLYDDWKAGRFDGARKLYVLEGASRSWELGYSGEFEQMEKEVPWLKYIPTISRPWEDKDWKGETGRVDDVIRKYASIWNLAPENTKVYLCGHPGMIENVTGIARRAGWPQDAIQSEAFFVIRDEVEATGTAG